MDKIRPPKSAERRARRDFETKFEQNAAVQFWLARPLLTNPAKNAAIYRIDEIMLYPSSF